MRRKESECPIRVTHKYVHNPEAVERGMELWASYLAPHVSKRIAQEDRPHRQPTP